MLSVSVMCHTTAQRMYTLPASLHDLRQPQRCSQVFWESALNHVVGQASAQVSWIKTAVICAIMAALSRALCGGHTWGIRF